MKHTPLPWEREKAQDGEVLGDGTGYAGDFYDTNNIISIDRETGETTNVGFGDGGHNTAFIVLACNAHYDLYDVVFRLNNYREAILAKQFDSNSESLIGLLDDARAALAKANPSKDA